MGQYGIKDIKGNELQVKLKAVNINGNVCGEFAEFSIEHIYENNSSSNIEATYTFPIPETAVLSGFEAVLGDRTIRGIVKEKEEANKAYEDALETGRATFLMEQLDTNKLKISIGRIIPNETVKIKITYLDMLTTNEDNTLKLLIPTIVGPRNVNKNNKCKRKINNMDRYKLSLNLLVESFTKMKFKSTTHSIKVERENDTFSRVSLGSENEFMDTDFVLILREEKNIETTGMVYKNIKEDRGILYLRLIPELNIDEEEGNNYIFLIDISESMKGRRIERAKNALQTCLRNLSEGDTFNIIAFGKELLFFSKEEQVTYNQENLFLASEWINKIEAEGETNVFKALEKSLSQKDDFIKTILLFTDDIVKNESEILNYVKDNIGENRIFTFGIGDSANSYFINKLAEYGHGIAEFIHDTEKIEDTILRQFSRIESPQVTDIKFDWGNMNVEETYPRTIDYMYDREPFSIFARVSGEIQGVVTISGKSNENEYIRQINLDNLNLEENANLISKIWYWKRIESISQKLKGERGEKAEGMRKKVVELSERSGIVCGLTSFIIVEEREEPVLGIQLKNIIPLKVTNNFVNKPIEDSSESSSEFLYKFVVKKKNIHYDKYYLDYHYSRNKILSIIAKNQFADGSFSDFIDRNDIDEKLETTALVLLTFTLGKEDIKVYTNQLRKSVNFIVDNIYNYEFNEDIYLHIIYALKSCVNKGVFNFKTREKIEDALNYLGKQLNDNENDHVNLLSNRYFMQSLFAFSKDGKSIEEKIVLKEEKNNIYNLAKLGILKLLDK